MRKDVNVVIQSRALLERLVGRSDPGRSRPGESECCISVPLFFVQIQYERGMADMNKGAADVSSPDRVWPPLTTI